MRPKSEASTASSDTLIDSDSCWGHSSRQHMARPLPPWGLLPPLAWESLWWLSCWNQWDRFTIFSFFFFFSVTESFWSSGNVMFVWMFGVWLNVSVNKSFSYTVGTKLKYKLGIVMGGRSLVHNCGLNRSIGYFMEPLLVLGLFSKKPITIRLKGVLSYDISQCFN